MLSTSSGALHVISVVTHFHCFYIVTQGFINIGLITTPKCNTLVSMRMSLLKMICTWQHFIDVLLFLFFFLSDCPCSGFLHLLNTRSWSWSWGSCGDLPRMWWWSCCPFYIIICLLFTFLFLFLIIIKGDETGAQV